MNKLLLLGFLTAITTLISAQNQLPVIQNATDSLYLSTQTFTLKFSLSDPENDPVEITLQYSEDNGNTFLPISSGLSGDHGFPVVTDGSIKEVQWDYSTFSLNVNPQDIRMRIIADDRQIVNIQQLVDQVDTNRLKSDLNYLTGIRHRNTGPILLEQTKDTLENLFAHQGVFQRRQAFNYSGYNAENIIGKKAGIMNAAEVYIIDAHFDSIEDSPGADDNASGTIGVMEACRILGQYDFEKTVKFIGFDLEEEGLVGSLKYVNEGGIENFEQIGGVINFDMIGYFDNQPNSQMFPDGFELIYPDTYNEIQADSFRGNFIVNIGNMISADFMSAYENAANQYVPGLKIQSILADAAGFTLPDLQRSDHASFWFRGHKALQITDGADFRNPYYHSSNDVLETVNIPFMANVIKASIATLAEEAVIRHSTSVVLPSNPISTATNSPECEFALSPNPASGMLSISLRDCSQPFQLLQVIDLQGRIVKSIQINNGFHWQLPTQSWPRGTYILKFVNDYGSISKKIIVAH